MKGKVLLGLLFVMVMFLGVEVDRVVQAQTVVPPITVQSTQPHTACALPPAGSSAYCFASDGLYESINGAAYALVNTPPPTAGVLSIAVNGGTPQTGAVALTIPTTASTTGTFTTTIH